MSGALVIDITGLDRLQERLAFYANPHLDRLFDLMGSEVESQTRLRITEEKKGPDGKKWQDWSPNYAKTRHGGQSLLEAEGHLVGSIRHSVVSEGVEVGSNLVYAALQQFGGEKIGKPQFVARPYLGLSDENRTDLEALVERFFERGIP
jgi:phage virion morphogenesis protein